MPGSVGMRTHTCGSLLANFLVRKCLSVETFDIRYSLSILSNQSLKGSELTVYAFASTVIMHSVRVVPLPGDPRYYNSYLVKVRAVVGNVNYGVYIPGKPPAESGGEGTTRRDLTTNIIFDYDERLDDIPELYPCLRSAPLLVW